MIATTIGISYAALSFLPAESTALLQLPIVTAAVVLIAGVGVLADIHPENVALRLLLQTIAVAAVIVTLPQEVRALPMIPLTAERIGGSGRRIVRISISARPTTVFQCSQ